MKDPYGKWRDPHVLFLDDGFDCDEAYSQLVQAGYAVERFSDHFKGERGTREQGIPDPVVMRLCNRNVWILITTDANMVRVHRREAVQCHDLGILATAHNTVKNIDEWVHSLIKLKPKLESNNFKKRPRPWFGTFNREGKFSTPVRTIE